MLNKCFYSNAPPRGPGACRQLGFLRLRFTTMSTFLFFLGYLFIKLGMLSLRLRPIFCVHCFRFFSDNFYVKIFKYSP